MPTINTSIGYFLDGVWHPLVAGVGPVGPPGATGPPGAIGPVGPPGPSVTGIYYNVVNSDTWLDIITTGAHSGDTYGGADLGMHIEADNHPMYLNTVNSFLGIDGANSLLLTSSAEYVSIEGQTHVAISSTTLDVTVNSGRDIIEEATRSVDILADTGHVILEASAGEVDINSGADTIFNPQGNLEITLQTGKSYIIRDSGGTPIFQVDEDGTITPSGGSPSIQYVTLNMVFDGSGSVVSTGIKGDAVVDFNATIVSWTLLADVSGSIVVDIWKDVYANYPPTVADTITASAKPTISGATKAQSSTLTGWTTSISTGSILRFNVDSASTITRATLALKLQRV